MFHELENGETHASLARSLARTHACTKANIEELQKLHARELNTRLSKKERNALRAKEALLRKHDEALEALAEQVSPL